MWWRDRLALQDSLFLRRESLALVRWMRYDLSLQMVQPTELLWPRQIGEKLWVFKTLLTPFLFYYSPQSFVKSSSFYPFFCYIFPNCFYKVFPLWIFSN